MATGFKTATVASAKVAATLSNYPTFVDLKRLNGGTSMTSAEAASIRVYADSSKTTEWAREIVSVDEMHVKIPSLTTTTTIYVDWDGSRSDYAVTDTYGRNAVWTNNRVVYHLDNENDSTSNGSTLTQTTAGGVTFGSGKVGKAGTSPDNSPGTKALRRASWAIMTDAEYAGSWKQTYWIKQNNTATAWVTTIMLRGSGTRYQQWTSLNSVGLISFLGGGATGPAATISFNTWTKIDVVANGTDLSIYKDGAFVSSATGYKTTTSAYQDNFGIFGYVESVVVQSSPISMDEYRLVVGTSGSSADWLTTEYNNQSDEATFWGTWTDAGGGSSIASYAGVAIANIKSYAGVLNIKSLGGVSND